MAEERQEKIVQADEYAKHAAGAGEGKAKYFDASARAAGVNFAPDLLPIEATPETADRFPAVQMQNAPHREIDRIGRADDPSVHTMDEQAKQASAPTPQAAGGTTGAVDTGAPGAAGGTASRAATGTETPAPAPAATSGTTRTRTTRGA